MRDLIAGHEPKDFDVATDARPNRIKHVFRGARIIGRRFRLAHVHFPSGKIIEAATFRGDPGPAEPQDADPGDGESASGPAERFGSENVFGTAAEDARRRDFTVNALFLDPVRDEVIDWVGGLADLEARTIRAIGDPWVRMREDPVRILRAVHMADRLGFAIEPDLERALREEAGALASASGARLYVELHKILGRGHARNTLRRLHDLGVLRVWLPELASHLEDGAFTWPAQAGGTHEEARHGEPEGLPAAHSTWNLLGAADRYGLAAHAEPESLGMAALFGPWLLETVPPHVGGHFLPFAEHMEATFRPVALRMSVPRRVSHGMVELLHMLGDLRHPPPTRRLRRLLHRAAFPTALTLFRLDLLARDGDPAEADRWEEIAADARPHGAQGAEPAFDGVRRPSRRRGRRGRGRATQRDVAVAPEADAWEPPPPPASPEHAPERPKAARPEEFDTGLA